MKKKEEDVVDLNQISLTGTRALIVLGLLVNAPRRLDELKKLLIQAKVMEENHSDDVIRIDLNTLRIMGFDITKGNTSQGLLKLNSNPFGLKITEDDVKLFKRIYKKVKYGSNVDLLIKYDALFEKLASSVSDKNIAEAILGISVIKSFDIELLKVLIAESHAKNTVQLSYNNPLNNKAEIKNVLLHDIYYQNEKIYINGFDKDKNEPVTLNVKRIKKILSRQNNKNDNIALEKTIIRFFITKFGVNGLDENEKIVEKRDNGFVIEGEYYNDFWAMQRVLSFGGDCTVISPENFKNDVIEKLKNMREVYNG